MSVMQVEIGAVLEGRITGITKYGAFVALPGGKVGMVHISEVSDSFVKEIRDYLKEDQQVIVKIINIDNNGKIALSIKRAQPESKKANHAAEAPTEYISGYSPSNKRRANTTGDPFEDMMQRFKAESDEKISDLKKALESKRSSPGFSRKNSNKY